MSPQEGMLVSVPVLTRPHDSASITTFSFSFYANVSYNSLKLPESITLNVRAIGWNSPVPPELDDIQTKILVSHGMSLEHQPCPSSCQLEQCQKRRLAETLLPKTSRQSMQPCQSMKHERKTTNELLFSVSPPSQDEIDSLLSLTIPSTSRSLPTSIAVSHPPSSTHSLTPSPPVFKSSCSNSISSTSRSSSFSLPPVSSLPPPLSLANSHSSTRSLPNTNSRTLTPMNMPSTSKVNTADTPTTSCIGGAPSRKRSTPDNNGSRLPRLTEMTNLILRKHSQYCQVMTSLGMNHDSSNLTCTQCHSTVPSSFTTLTQHLGRHIAATPLFKCVDCQFVSPYSHMIQQHTRITHRDRSPFEFIDQRSLFDEELSETAFKCFFDFTKFAMLP